MMEFYKGINMPFKIWCFICIGTLGLTIGLVSLMIEDAGLSSFIYIIVGFISLYLANLYLKDMEIEL